MEVVKHIILRLNNSIVTTLSKSSVGDNNSTRATELNVTKSADRQTELTANNIKDETISERDASETGEKKVLVIKNEEKGIEDQKVLIDKDTDATVPIKEENHSKNTHLEDEKPIKTRHCKLAMEDDKETKLAKEKDDTEKPINDTCSLKNINNISKIGNINMKTELVGNEVEFCNLEEITSDVQQIYTSYDKSNDGFQTSIPIIRINSTDTSNSASSIDECVEIISGKDITSNIKEHNDNKPENTSNDDSTENLISSLSPKEWLDLDEYENIIKDLNHVGSLDNCDFEENIEKYIVEKKCISNGETVTVNKINLNTHLIEETNDGDVISISSDEDIDLKLSLSLDDLETISMSSIEGLCVDEIYDNKSGLLVAPDKIVTEQEEYISLDDIKTQSLVNSTKDGPKRNKDIVIITLRETTQNLNTTDQSRIECLDLDEDNFKTNGSLTKTNEDADDIVNVSDESMAENIKENEIDTISHRSNDSFGNLEDCAGYNSSDFEFITEEEAYNDGGLIINYYKKKERNYNNDTCKAVEITTDSGFNGSSSSQNSDSFHPIDLPGPSTGAFPRIPRNTMGRPSIMESNYTENHAIPEGDQYLNLFQGIYAPSTPYMYEDKSMESRIDQRYEGLGFDMRLVERQARACDVADEYKKEANENAKKILNMYPEDNRKRRRRF